MKTDTSNYNLDNSTANEDEYYSRPFEPEDDYFEELREAQGIRCQACYGTGLDRYEDVDCLVCWGEGVLYGNV